MGYTVTPPPAPNFYMPPEFLRDLVKDTLQIHIRVQTALLSVQALSLRGISAGPGAYKGRKVCFPYQVDQPCGVRSSRKYV